MNLSAKIAQNTLVQIVSKVIATILGLFTLALMTRYLGKTGFGEYTTIITFLSFFAIIADLGLTLVTVQMISDPAADEKKVLNNLFTLRLVLALIFLGVGPLSVFLFPYNATIKIGVMFAAASFVFIALNQVLVGLFQKKLTMGKVAIAEVAGRVVLLGGVGLAIYTNSGLMAILWATVISSLINFLLQFIFAQKFVTIRLAKDWDIWKTALKKSWPLALTIAFNLIYLKTDTLILSLIKTQEEVGLYGSTYKIIDVLVTLPFMFAGVILPLLTANWIQKNYDYFKAIFQKAYDFMVILALPIIIGTQFLAKDIMTLVAGPEFADAGQILRVLIIAASLIFISCLFSHIIIAIDRQRKIIGAYVFTSLTAVLGYLIFIPKYSYFGAAWMTIYSEAAILLFAIYYVYKYTKMFPKQKVAGKALLSSLLMGGILYLIPKTFYQTIAGLTITTLIAIITYFLLLFIFKGLTKDDFKMFLPRRSTSPLVPPLENIN